MAFRMKTLATLPILCAALLPTIGDLQSAQPKKRTAVVNSIGMKLTRIPAGRFVMGSPKGEAEREDGTEAPHTVEITTDFYMGVYEVTQKQYQAVMGENPSHFSDTGSGKAKVTGLGTDDFPVEQVRYKDALMFCEKLTAREKTTSRRVYRLPTEAEWEYASRGGAESSKPFHIDGKASSSLASTQANFIGDYPYGDAAKKPYLKRTCEVGSYRPNGYGLYDMHGNVYEWCSDWFSADYYEKSPKSDPKGPADGSNRVIRGGSWGAHGRFCRSANRESLPPGYRHKGTGFRVIFVEPRESPR